MKKQNYDKLKKATDELIENHSNDWPLGAPVYDIIDVLHDVCREKAEQLEKEADEYGRDGKDFEQCRKRVVEMAKKWRAKEKYLLKAYFATGRKPGESRRGGIPGCW